MKPLVTLTNDTYCVDANAQHDEGVEQRVRDDLVEEFHHGVAEILARGEFSDGVEAGGLALFFHLGEGGPPSVRGHLALELGRSGALQLFLNNSIVIIVEIKMRSY